MKTYKEEIRKAIDNVICDCCGQSCDTINMGPFDYPYDHDPLNGKRYFT